MVFYVDMFEDHTHTVLMFHTQIYLLKTSKNHVKHFAITIFQVSLTNQKISST
jgi:hypothetical protein